MRYQIMSVLILIVLCSLMLFVIGWTIYKRIIRKESNKTLFFSKKNLVFFIPLYLISVTLYSFAYGYVNGKYDIVSLLDCLFYGLKGFALEINHNVIDSLANDNIVFKIDIIIVVILSGLTMISAVVQLFFITLENKIKVFGRIHQDHLDIIIGDSELALEFCRNDDHSILMIDSFFSSKRIDSKYAKDLLFQKIVYIKKLINAENIIKLARKQTNVFLLDTETKKINQILGIIEGCCSKNEKDINFYILTDKESRLYIDKELKNACKRGYDKWGGIKLDEKGNVVTRRSVMAISFDLYGVIGRHFSKKYNFAQFLPQSWIKDGALISEDKKIKVKMLGLGKTGNALLEATILNNQMVAVDKDGTYKIQPIEYDLYDNDRTKAPFEKKIVSLFEEKDGARNKRTGLPEIEKNAVIHTHPYQDVKNDFTNDCISDLENEFVFYFICLSSTTANLDMANFIMEHCNPENTVVFYCVDNSKEDILKNDKKKGWRIYPVGFKEEIFKSEYITDEEAWDKAEELNKTYNRKLSIPGEEFTKRDIIEKRSNLYHAMNLEFRLNLLGLTKEKEKALNDTLLTKQEFLDIYEKGFYLNKFEDYFTVQCAKNVLRAQEHARWSVFYYMNGFETMPLKDVKAVVKVDEDNKSWSIKTTHKNIDKLQHACMTSLEGLRILHNWEADKALEAIDDEIKKAEKEHIDVPCPLTKEEALMKVETLQYDTMALDEIEKHYDKFKLYLLKRYSDLG